MTSLQTTQAYQVTYDYGKEGALVDALLGGDVPERRTPRKANQAQVAALPDDDDGFRKTAFVVSRNYSPETATER